MRILDFGIHELELAPNVRTITGLDDDALARLGESLAHAQESEIRVYEEGGVYYVWDGQRRLLAARARKDIPTLRGIVTEKPHHVSAAQMRTADRESLSTGERVLAIAEIYRECNNGKLTKKRGVGTKVAIETGLDATEVRRAVAVARHRDLMDLLTRCPSLPFRPISDAAAEESKEKRGNALRFSLASEYRAHVDAVYGPPTKEANGEGGKGEGGRRRPPRKSLTDAQSALESALQEGGGDRYQQGVLDAIKWVLGTGPCPALPTSESDEGDTE